MANDDKAIDGLVEKPIIPMQIATTTPLPPIPAIVSPIFININTKMAPISMPS